MPRLYSMTHDFNAKNPKFQPDHFFPSAYYGRNWSSSESRWTFNLDKDFPACSFIHYDEMEKQNNTFWINLRKDVERRYQGDCFYIYDRKDYQRWWNKNSKGEYDKQYGTQRHGYWTFYFEEKSDQTMFILNHGSIISNKKYRFHPVMGISCEDQRYDVPDDEHVKDAWKI